MNIIHTKFQTAYICFQCATRISQCIDTETKNFIYDSLYMPLRRRAINISYINDINNDEIDTIRISTN